MSERDEVVLGEQQRVGQHGPHAVAVGLSRARSGCGLEDLKAVVFEQGTQSLPLGGVTLQDEHAHHRRSLTDLFDCTFVFRWRGWAQGGSAHSGAKRRVSRGVLMPRR